MYAVVLMFVCGGSSTCRSVCVGVVNCVRTGGGSPGRHFAKAPRSAAAAAEAAAAAAAEAASAAVAVAAAVLRASLSKQACIFWNCAAVGRGMFRRNEKVWPPVFSFATIFGTTPSWCSASRVRPGRHLRDVRERGDLLRRRSAGR